MFACKLGKVTAIYKPRTNYRCTFSNLQPLHSLSYLTLFTEGDDKTGEQERIGMRAFCSF